MPLPFDFEGKGVLLDVDLILQKNPSFQLKNTFSGDSPPSSYRFLDKNLILERNSSFGEEPTSVLDSTGIPSRPTSSSTPSSSGGGGGDGGRGQQKQDSTTATSASNAVPALGGGGDGQMGNNTVPKFAIEDWESVLSDDVSPCQEPSELRWIMSSGGAGDVEDPYKVLQLSTNNSNNQSLEFDFSGGGFGAVDQENFCGGAGLIPVDPPILDHHRSTNLSTNFGNNLQNFGSFSFDPFTSIETKPATIFNSELFISHNQSQNNPSFLYPFTNHQIEHIPFLQQPPPPPKRHNPISKGTSNHLLNNPPHQLQFLTPPYQEQSKMASHSSLQQSIFDQLFKASESVQTGNLALAQAILARLNHQLSDENSANKPFVRAAFYCKEALQLALLTDEKTVLPSPLSPLSLVFKIAACKTFSEASPAAQFANFTCNQSILESVEGLGRVHVVDFDVGLGGQWSSLMQELSFHGSSLKITVIPSSVHSHLELGLARENLSQFAMDLNLPFEFHVSAIDSFPFHSLEGEGTVVNLPAGVLAGGQLPAHSVLRFVKQLSPKIVVSVDRGCERTDLPFASHVVHVAQYYSSLMESLEAVGVSHEGLQKVERFLLRTEIEGIVSKRVRSMEKAQHWRALFLSFGFSPGSFSNFAESLAECVIRRAHVRGFTMEKRQSCLVLCWQRKELVSLSAWKCC